MKTIQLKPIQESTKEFEEIEKKMVSLFKRQIYFPLLAVLNLKQKTLKNARLDPVSEAIQMGKIYYEGDRFAGSFDAGISKELRALGAKWDRKSSTYVIAKNNLPVEIQGSISISQVRFQEKLRQVDDILARMSPENITEQLNISQQFDSSIFKMEKDFKDNVKKITVSPELSAEQRQVVADQWQNNMKLWVKKFTEEQIVELRTKIQTNMTQGSRREDVVKDIQKSFSISYNKAKFLARQETNLLVAKFQETRYKSVGVDYYKWGCVKMPHQPSPTAPYKPGDVRYDHGILEGKYFTWDSPQEVDLNGQPKAGGVIKPRGNLNPKQDYNCLPGSSLVSFHSSVNKAFRRPFSGEMAELVTDDGIIINATGNHPILTDRGWLSIKDVQVGDNVFTCKNESLFTKKMNSKDVKSSAEQIFDALSFCLEITSDTLTESDFHNDVGEYKKVDIINVNRELVFDSIIEAHKEISHFIFERSDSSILEFSPVNIFLKNLVSRNVSSSYLSLLGQIELILFTHFAHAKYISFRTISNGNSSLNEPFSNRTTSNCIFIGNCKLTHPVLVIINSLLIESQFVERRSLSSNNIDTNISQFDAQNIRMHADNLSDFIKSESPSFIKPLRINNKRVFAFSGFVYNFETSTNWYLAENIILHNCRCFAIPILKLPKS